MNLFAADLALKRLDAAVHSGVVEDVPGARELLVAAVELSNVDDERFAVEFLASDLCLVRKVFELLEV